jgi:hypothetical protein
MKEAVPVYEEKVKPLEQCLVEANDVLVEVEPFGLSFGNEQLNKLKVRHILYINWPLLLKARYTNHHASSTPMLIYFTIHKPLIE